MVSVLGFRFGVSFEGFFVAGILFFEGWGGKGVGLGPQKNMAISTVQLEVVFPRIFTKKCSNNFSDIS